MALWIDNKDSLSKYKASCGSLSAFTVLTEWYFLFLWRGSRLRGLLLHSALIVDFPFLLLLWHRHFLPADYVLIFWWLLPFPDVGLLLSVAVKWTFLWWWRRLWGLLLVTAQVVVFVFLLLWHWDFLPPLYILIFRRLLPFTDRSLLLRLAVKQVCIQLRGTWWRPQTRFNIQYQSLPLTAGTTTCPPETF